MLLEAGEVDFLPHTARAKGEASASASASASAHAPALALLLKVLPGAGFLGTTGACACADEGERPWNVIVRMLPRLLPLHPLVLAPRVVVPALYALEVVDAALAEVDRKKPESVLPSVVLTPTLLQIILALLVLLLLLSAFFVVVVSGLQWCSGGMVIGLERHTERDKQRHTRTRTRTRTCPVDCYVASRQENAPENAPENALENAVACSPLKAAVCWQARKMHCQRESGGRGESCCRRGWCKG